MLSKLLYSLEVVCRRQADKHRLDAFHCQCVRRILGIPQSMVSHVNNAHVLQQAAEKPLSQTVLARQLLFYGRLAGLSEHSMLRNSVLQPDSPTPKQFLNKRRQGRPRLAWSSVLYAHAVSAIGGRPEALQDILCGRDASMTVWRTVVKEYCQG